MTSQFTITSFWRQEASRYFGMLGYERAGISSVAHDAVALFFAQFLDRRRSRVMFLRNEL